MAIATFSRVRSALAAAPLACAFLLSGSFALVAVSSGAAASDVVRKKTVAVAAAADLKFALDTVVEEYQRDHPDVDIKVTYGSSGNFFTQIAQKAPFDLFLSADAEYPRQLVDKKLAKQDTLFVYAIGRLVLWSPKSTGIDVEKLGLAALQDPKARKIAIANPRHAPYGRAAVAVLNGKDLYSGVEKRLVYGENVAQTAEFARSGGADLAFIALALALAPAMRDAGSYWQVPVDAFPTLEQAGVELESARDPTATAAFRGFLAGARGLAILEKFGFTRPGA